MLNAAPLTDVVIDVSSGDLGEATVSPVQLTFTPTSWSTPQTVTMTVVDDAVVGVHPCGVLLEVPPVGV